jgi:hypothetical protein
MNAQAPLSAAEMSGLPGDQQGDCDLILPSGERIGRIASDQGPARLLSRSYMSPKKFSSTCLRMNVSSTTTPQLCSIIRFANSGPSISTRRAFTRSA